MQKHTSTPVATMLHTSASFLGLLLAASLIAAPAFAADTLRADVPFAFLAGSKSLPAGTYEFMIDRSAQTVAIHGPGNATANELIITTLAPSAHSTADHADLVFDKVGATYTLSELWEPGSDGLLVHATKEKHEHHVLHLKKS